MCHDAAAATTLGGDRAAENGIVPARPLAVLKTVTVTQCFDVKCDGCAGDGAGDGDAGACCTEHAARCTLRTVLQQC